MTRTPPPWPLAAVLVVSLSVSAALTGCSKRSAEAGSTSVAAAPMATAASPGDSLAGAKDADESQGRARAAPSATGGTVAPDPQRRVIHKAELSLEADAPDFIQGAVTSLAAARGGFVVGADTTRFRSPDGSESITTTVTFRVPATQFDATLISLHALATHVASEKVTGEDVTEEYVDLEARIRARRALEDQYLTILKEAKTIPDTLAVEQKLGEVRSDIERAEGRRRFLANQSDLSTFTIHVARYVAAPVVDDGPGFGRSVKEAGKDAVGLSIVIVNGLIRALGFAVPLLVIVVLPLYFALRWWWRSRRRHRDD